jgi:hypothetical protein
VTTVALTFSSDPGSEVVTKFQTAVVSTVCSGKAATACSASNFKNWRVQSSRRRLTGVNNVVDVRSLAVSYTATFTFSAQLSALQIASPAALSTSVEGALESNAFAANLVSAGVSGVTVGAVTTTPVTTYSPTPKPHTPTKKASDMVDTGAIIGGVIGGVFGLLLIAAVIIVACKYFKNKAVEAGELQKVKVLEVRPFTPVPVDSLDFKANL